LEIADRCRFSLDELQYQYPDEVSTPGMTPQQTLEQLTFEGAARRYPDGTPDKVTAILKHELGLIERLDYAPYFLTVNSIVAFARSRDILCQGRGSAANSAVCYVLGITSIDPERNDLLFERFVSEERREPPDIDVDFEHERREIVMQWVFDTYGRDHAALCSVVIRYRAKAAIRDVGKALGLPEDLTKALSSQIWHWSEEGVEDKHLKELNLNLEDRRLRLTLELAHQLQGAPRHLSQHPGGFVLTRDRLDDLVPIEPAAMKDRQVIEWDKDDIDSLKFMKVDCLALGMMSCMKRGLDLLRDHKGIDLDLATIPAEDPRTYAMIRKADTLGVFQIESRAQMAMLPRIKPRTFYDLVIEVAIVRPGPIQGDMVHPYLRRREGKEPVEYPKPELEKVLGKTLGVPLFQEQAMRVAIECAGFTASEADQLRRAMATFKFTGGVSHFRDKLVNGMVERGYTEAFASTNLQPAGGLRLLRLSRKPRGLLRPDRLRLVLAQMLAPGRLLRGPAQRPAHGLLRSGPDRPGRPRARRRDPPALHQRLALGLQPGADPPSRTVRRPAGPEDDFRSLKPTQQRSSAPAPTRPSPRSTMSGAAPASRRPVL
jgi:error-prone DNA polymerase